MVSVSDDKPVKSSGLRVLVAYEPVASAETGANLDVEEIAQVLENFHLVAVVFTVIFYVALCFSQFTHHRFLLLLLDLEVLVEGLDVGHEAFIRVGDVLGLTLNTFLERFKNVSLHVI